MTRFIYLASQSPRRRQLLEQVGVAYELLLPEADEDAEALEAECVGEGPDAYVRRVTRAKLEAACARRVRRGLVEAPVLCADTTVALGRKILGKPSSPDHAAETLRQLSGKAHRVLTAVALAWDDVRLLEVSVSRVQFAELSDEQIRHYVDSGEPFGKAGAYAIQSSAAAWVSRMQGSYSGIMGLPLFETAQLLRRAGWAI